MAEMTVLLRFFLQWPCRRRARFAKGTFPQEVRHGPNTEDITVFKARLRVNPLAPGESDYNAARVVWNGMIDRRPGMIAQCPGVADVVAAVDSRGRMDARRGPRRRSQRSRVCGVRWRTDDRSVAHAEGPRRSGGTAAWVQGGATWGDVDHETIVHLATPGGVVSMTGVGGLTLSGGIGWLRQTHGLCVDNIASVDIVTADGRLFHADDINHPELFWAVRGGGGNFGIVTSFEFRLHPIAPKLMFCSPLYRSRCAQVISAWRDFMATAPERSAVSSSSPPSRVRTIIHRDPRRSRAGGGGRL